MSCQLSKDLKTKYDCRSIPVRKGDTIMVTTGSQKGREGKVIAVYRKRWCLYVEKFTKEKMNGQQVNIPIHTSNCLIKNLRLDKDRKALLGRKKRGEKVKNSMRTMD